MSLEKVNEILKQAESLTGEEKRYLAQQLLAGSPSEVEEKQRQIITPQKQLPWLAHHRTQYAGQWVALDGEQLIGPGTNSREVLAQARKLGVPIPFVAYLEPLDARPFGGW